MKIVLRTKEGWSGKVENKKPENCDICGSRLWIAPHGAPYCDAVHTDEEVSAKMK